MFCNGYCIVFFEKNITFEKIMKKNEIDFNKNIKFRFIF